MTERRFTDKPSLDPAAVRGLAPDHPAMVENRTLFPTTVVEVTSTEPDRLLVSGRNNRKLGETVAKGAFKGYALFGLSLEERASCPDDCAVRDICYGNGMQMARRHRIGDPDVFFDRLGYEIADLTEEHEGVLVRLHVLGDFPSVEYVAFWADALNEYPNLAVYGYTARRTTAWGGDDIGDAVEALKDQFPDRFRIRWSSPVSRPDGTVVIDRAPTTPRVEEGLVCPAQTDATACCASCGLCWEPAMRGDTIAFIRHGPKSAAAAAESAMASAAAKDGNEGRQLRPVEALALGGSSKPAPITAPTPDVRLVDPKTLLIESIYQRDLSAKSISLIRKIVAEWDWAKFKPPVCAEGPDGLYVIDGQHTAIGAASHPAVVKIPVVIVSADAIEKRAAAFVSHNRDRVAMSPLQVFHANAVAGDQPTRLLIEIAARTGASIPRSVPGRGNRKPGQVIDTREALKALAVDGEETVERIFRIAVGASLAPLTGQITRALRMVLKASAFSDVARLPDSAISNALKSLPGLEQMTRARALESGDSYDRTCALFIADAARGARVAA